MKATIYEKYGSPDVLQLKEVEKPIPRDNEVLIKVLAVSINDWDWQLLHGTPWTGVQKFDVSSVIQILFIRN